MTSAESGREQRYVLLGLGLLGILIGILACVYQGTFDSGDSINHFLFSKYAFTHPHLLLDHWAKPFFTLVSAPFAQFGFFGIQVFNILLSLGSAFLAYKIAVRMGLALSWMVSVFLLGAPLFLLAMFSGLTEPLFGFLLVLGLFQWLNGKQNFALVLISFLPFVRSEGFLILAIWGAYLIWAKEWRRIPWLGLGFGLYAIVGFFYYGDLLWIFTQNAYGGEMSNYGSGDLLHFPQQYLYVVGLPLYILSMLGLIGMVITLLQKKIREKTEFLKEKVFLIYGCFLAYFCAHIAFWYLGIFHSMGLNRVMIAILPLGAFIALDGYLLLWGILTAKLPQIRKGFLLLVLAVVILFPFSGNKAGIDFPREISLTTDQQLIQEMKDWIGVEGLKTKKVYARHPYIPLALEIDPFDTLVFSNDLNVVGLGTMESGSIFIWDGWFAVQESGVEYGFWEWRDGYTVLKRFETGEGRGLNQVFVVRRD